MDFYYAVFDHQVEKSQHMQEGLLIQNISIFAYLNGAIGNSENGSGNGKWKPTFKS